MEPQVTLAGNTATPVEQDRGSFKVFLAFDTPAAKAEGLSTAEYVRGQLGEDFDFAVSSWSLAYLSAPRLRDRAMDEAVEAEMLIFSIQRADGQEKRLKQWMSALKRRRNKTGAVVALIPSYGDEEPSPLFQVLEQGTLSAGLDFIAKFTRAVS